VSGQFHVPAALRLQKETPIAIEYGAEVLLRVGVDKLGKRNIFPPVWNRTIFPRLSSLLPSDDFADDHTSDIVLYL